MAENNTSSCRKRRRKTELQQILRLLRKTHKEVHAILAIVSNGSDTDFSKEDAIVKKMTGDIRAAKHRIPPRISPVTKPKKKGT